jgi:hypothetical protein
MKWIPYRLTSGGTAWRVSYRCNLVVKEIKFIYTAAIELSQTAWQGLSSKFATLTWDRGGL